MQTSIAFAFVLSVIHVAVALQYQHWIPQFIIRNFAPVRNGATRQTSTRSRKQRVHFYDKKTNTVTLTSTADIFGAYDLYEDSDSLMEVAEMENKFSLLETAASPLIKAVVQSNILPRDKHQLFVLRIFLFTLTLRKESYRNFYSRGLFNAETEEAIVKHMKQHSMESTHQVWINDLSLLLTLQKESEIAELKNKMFPVNHAALVEFMKMNTQIWKVNPNVNAELFLSDSNMGKWVGTPQTFEKIVVRYFFPISPQVAIVMEADKKAFQQQCRKIGLPTTSFFHLMGVQDVPMTSRTNKIMGQNAVDQFNNVLFDDAYIAHGIVFRSLEIFRKSKFVADGEITVVKRKVERKPVLPFESCDYTLYEYTGQGQQKTFYCMFCGTDFRCRTEHAEIEGSNHEEMHRQRFEDSSFEEKGKILEQSELI